jgi:hypothetical protein
MPRSSLNLGRRSGRSAQLLGAVSLLMASVVVLVAPAAAEPAPAPAPRAAVGSPVDFPVAVAKGSTEAATRSVPVGSLTVAGTATTITVRKVFRTGQVQWINHVISTRLLALDRCQGRRSRTTWDGHTYRATVRIVCADGPTRSEAAVHQLVRDRPWYQAQKVRVPLVGFGLLADLPSGNDRAVPAALAQLPSGPFTFSEGDDVSLNYVGQKVTQAQLDAAATAFARALGVPASKIEITPLAEP